MGINHFFIFLVDDKEDDSLILIRALQAIGSTYSIQIAKNGAEALEQLKEMKQEGRLPSLIVVDINMPKMDGKQTIVALQQNEDFAACTNGCAQHLFKCGGQVIFRKEKC